MISNNELSNNENDDKRLETIRNHYKWLKNLIFYNIIVNIIWLIVLGL